MNRLSLAQCQRRLALVWTLLGGAAFLLTFVQTLPDGAYGGVAKSVWPWFLPTIIPSLSLIVTTVFANARSPQSEATVDAFAYRLCLGLSVVYLALVIAVLLAFAQRATPAADFESAGIPLAALQALVGIALGAFFVSKRSEGSDRARAAGGE
jgi:hypothetical protein